MKQKKVFSAGGLDAHMSIGIIEACEARGRANKRQRKGETMQAILSVNATTDGSRFFVAGPNSVVEIIRHSGPTDEFEVRAYNLFGVLVRHRSFRCGSGQLRRQLAELQAARWSNDFGPVVRYECHLSAELRVSCEQLAERYGFEIWID